MTTPVISAIMNRLSIRKRALRPLLLLSASLAAVAVIASPSSLTAS